MNAQSFEKKCRSNTLEKKQKEVQAMLTESLKQELIDRACNGDEEARVWLQEAGVWSDPLIYSTKESQILVLHNTKDESNETL